MADGAPIVPAHSGVAGSALPAELLVWLSPAFPTGGFAFSHGLERLAEAGMVHSRETLEHWLGDLAARGSLRNDLIVLAAAWRATVDCRLQQLDEIAELAAALAPSRERQLETLTQGRGFATAIDAAWACPSVTHLQQREAGQIAYPVAVGAAAGDQGLEIGPVLEAFAIAFVTNLTSAAIRLGIIGQFDAQRVIAALLPVLRAAAASAITSTLDDLGGAMFVCDIASMEHETQYTRLFRS